MSEHDLINSHFDLTETAKEFGLMMMGSPQVTFSLLPSQAYCNVAYAMMFCLPHLKEHMHA